jgi:hypothetical protein
MMMMIKNETVIDYFSYHNTGRERLSNSHFGRVFLQFQGRQFCCCILEAVVEMLAPPVTLLDLIRLSGFRVQAECMSHTFTYFSVYGLGYRVEVDMLGLW